MLRPLTDADAEAAAALIRAAFAAIHPPLDPAPSALRVDAAALGAHLEAGGGGALSGDDGVVLWIERDAGLYVSRLAVHPRAWGRGIATALLEEAEAEARRRTLPRLHLGVRLALTANRRLFRRAGFTETTRHHHDGYAEPTWVAAEKRLLG